jgi:hypothetical protein
MNAGVLCFQTEDADFNPQPVQGQTPAARFDRQIQKNRVKSIVSRLLRLISEVFGFNEFHADFGSIPAKKEEEGDSDD